jgi:hypothetical protein
VSAHSTLRSDKRERGQRREPGGTAGQSKGGRKSRGRAGGDDGGSKQGAFQTPTAVGDGFDGADRARLGHLSLSATYKISKRFKQIFESLKFVAY